ncbi:helix-turn-helix domain-containing protein [Priestia megaterium]|uniref:helix-turn-helix domain-containing protein n=1 Tax=Priestia megaterium TaxID=1404 RepID=UPI00203B5FA7|nr:helix-turn-helix domain-containing protein [Priestia megaterium]MCM3154982.1 helix-turn-helix domain-containing protein [Priestia megaterium]
MKKRIDVIAGEESFNNLSCFNELEEMNKTVRAYKETIIASVKRVDVQARLISLIELLKRHSCKQLGVSYMCKNTIANKLEVSYKTVQRLMKKLEVLGMIRQIPMKRKTDMLQTSNVVLIVPIEEMTDKTTSKESEKCPTIKTTTNSLKQKSNNKRNDVPISQNKVVKSFSKANFIAHWVPERFSDLTSCYYTEAQTIQELWKVVQQCNRVVNYATSQRAFTPQQELAIGIRAFKEFVMKIKRNKKIQNKFGYFNGIVNRLMDILYFDDNFLKEFR